jgi:hypothetical protein
MTPASPTPPVPAQQVLRRYRIARPRWDPADASAIAQSSRGRCPPSEFQHGSRRADRSAESKPLSVQMVFELAHLELFPCASAFARRFVQLKMFCEFTFLWAAARRGHERSYALDTARLEIPRPSLSQGSIRRPTVAGLASRSRRRGSQHCRGQLANRTAFFVALLKRARYAFPRP